MSWMHNPDMLRQCHIWAHDINNAMLRCEASWIFLATLSHTHTHTYWHILLSLQQHPMQISIEIFHKLLVYCFRLDGQASKTNLIAGYWILFLALSVRACSKFFAKFPNSELCIPACLLLRPLWLAETDPVDWSTFYVRFEVFTAVTMKNAALWDVTPCGSCKNRRFGEKRSASIIRVTKIAELGTTLTVTSDRRDVF
jgi:hypothetical protein